jgi:hypothetical protein
VGHSYQDKEPRAASFFWAAAHSFWYVSFQKAYIRLYTLRSKEIVFIRLHLFLRYHLTPLSMANLELGGIPWYGVEVHTRVARFCGRGLPKWS